MPARLRYFNTPNFYRYMQPQRGGNQPHSTYYAFYLRDPIAMIGTGLLFILPLFAVVEDYYKDYRRKINLAADLNAPFTGFIIEGARTGDWSEKRYGDNTDVGSIYEIQYNDGSVQEVRDYPYEFEHYANFLDEENKKYEREAEKVRALQESARQHRREEWLRLNQQA